MAFEEIRNKLSIHLTPKSLRQACIFKWLAKVKEESLIKEWMGVSPHYDFKRYRQHLSSYAYDERFLKELYQSARGASLNY